MYFGSIKSFKIREIRSTEGVAVAVADVESEEEERKMLTQFSTSPAIQNYLPSFKGKWQISAKQGPSSRFVIEANRKPLLPKSNSRRSKKMKVQGRSIRLS